MKIKSMADARAITDLLVSHPNHFPQWYSKDGYDHNPSIMLWDKDSTNMIMVFLEQEGLDWKVALTDTVNDSEIICRVTIDQIETIIWKNRKFINFRGQLDHIRAGWD